MNYLRLPYSYESAYNTVSNNILNTLCKEENMVKKFLKRAGACLLCVSMVLTSNVGSAGVSASSGKGAAVETKTGSIVIDGNDIKADNVNGLTYKGLVC